MKCRRIKDEVIDNVRHRTIVWFGSYGRNDDGTAKFFNTNDKHDNFAKEQQGVVDSLIQRLSVIKSELWYNVSYGLPLQSNSKLAIDSEIVKIVSNHPDVMQIVDFTSAVNNHAYRCDLIVQTKYGIVDISI